MKAPVIFLLAATTIVLPSGATLASVSLPVGAKETPGTHEASEGTRPGPWTPGLVEPVEHPLERSEHKLAPGDLLSLLFWGPVEASYLLEVAADGALLVPSLGCIEVAGRNVAEAESLVASIARVAFPSSRVALRLVRAAHIKVWVTGAVMRPGIYELGSGSRLSDAIVAAEGLTEASDVRRIVIWGAGRKPAEVDLLRWRVMGEEAGNPVLQSGARVFVPRMRATYQVAGAAASIRVPPSGSASQLRVIPHRPGDTVSFAIAAAGGPGSASAEEGAWLLRGSTRQWVPADSMDRVLLEPGDRVEVPVEESWIAVSGAVVRPGLYPYVPGQTAAAYVFAAGGPSLAGRHDGWNILSPDGTRSDLDPADPVPPGSRIWVPQRRTRTISEFLTPLSTAVALIVSLTVLLK